MTDDELRDHVRSALRSGEPRRIAEALSRIDADAVITDAWRTIARWTCGAS